MKLLGTAWSSFSNDACRVMSALLLEMLDKLWNSATVLDKLSLINAGNYGVKSKIYRYDRSIEQYIQISVDLLFLLNMPSHK